MTKYYKVDNVDYTDMMMIVLNIVTTRLIAIETVVDYAQSKL